MKHSQGMGTPCEKQNKLCASVGPFTLASPISSRRVSAASTACLSVGEMRSPPSGSGEAGVAGHVSGKVWNSAASLVEEQAAATAMWWLLVCCVGNGAHVGRLVQPSLSQGVPQLLRSVVRSKHTHQCPRSCPAQSPPAPPPSACQPAAPAQPARLCEARDAQHAAAAAAAGSLLQAAVAAAARRSPARRAAAAETRWPQLATSRPASEITA